ncbi:MAG: amino acid ABC transporter permease [Frankia sp.]|nr:amino acid ABC transporter permease [Frankia sp.]
MARSTDHPLEEQPEATNPVASGPPGAGPLDAAAGPLGTAASGPLDAAPPGPSATADAASDDDPAGAAPVEPITAVPVRHPWRWVGVAVIGLLLAMAANSLVTNPRFEWDVVWDYLFSEQVLRGVWATVYLTVYAMAVGIVGGVLLAVLRLSPNPLLRGASWVYTWFFRGTPVMIQILFWGAIGSLYPRLSIGIPFGPEFVSGRANDLIPVLAAVVLGLGLNEAAYMAEIVRAGINSVDPGQVEAAHALGMGRLLTLRRIVLPQAMRVIIPPTGNETISMLKTTSLASVIAFTELLYAVQLIYARNFRTIPLLIVAGIWYLALTSVLSVGQYYLERHYDPGGRPSGGPSGFRLKGAAR